ncbi:VOC family protein [Paenibacillus arenosi]|uniref:VOC family protein n=1 Tax=Paenibacillus arenosi TaxID=2774142 RepID=A0ABR9B2E7_9BACL|nr:VOC family protein [Paenibacillus arenosi]MBD8499356.1 VOC family protein [Paenibacillus arenosi]
MLKCSHIICKVADITTAVRDYESLGFTMQWGSAPERAHNALLWFEAGPFIELFQIPTSFSYLSLPLGVFYGRGAGKRFKHWSSLSEGWCDVALEPARNPNVEMLSAQRNRMELQEIRQTMNHSGIPTSRIINGKRIRPDGSMVRYSLFAPNETGLPFMVSHYDPPQRPKRIEHPNGATGIEWVKMGVPQQLSTSFQSLLAHDKWLRAESVSQQGVIEVALSGLNQSLDTNLLHGARFVAANR